MIVDEFKAMSGRWYHRYEKTGDVIETDVLVCKTEDWPAYRQSKDPLWRPRDYDGITIAVKVLT